MKTDHTESASHPSRRHLLGPSPRPTLTGWEQNYSTPVEEGHATVAEQRRRITQRRWLALGINLLNLALLIAIHFAFLQAGADVRLLIPASLAVWLPLWYGALFLQAKEAFDTVELPSILPYLNFALVVAMPFVVFGSALAPNA